ncbi:hypothetical protein TPHA_0H00330 [Tetrapisispora phaffii CBS 4417]|uniref:mRNA m(6)A methyltransferase n=1 Tax=Tetrapisispora phaffii (strain ATCC 24235 / CBS 4417 / NBRC 1672 / NRRL Y-8282 / UCD 70-5) TaxID=1071381 RepID=G8BWT9_TETPH|nr:hypothetical protein TPHA_0H00330 [Tetrapisispora phaffii CBS 4417]CCE64243.1 hypothetical protein TPHA_0H00330 [Tetrapisispora phaffii CBS 4417]
MVNLELLDFLIESHAQLVAEPVMGNMEDLFVLYKGIYIASGDDSYSLERFVEDIDSIANTSKGSIVFEENRLLSIEKSSHITKYIKLIDVYLLNLLHEQLVPSSRVNRTKNSKTDAVECAPASSSNLMDRLMVALDSAIEIKSDIESRKEKVWNHYLFSKLDELLTTNVGSNILGKERAMHNTPVAEFIPICANTEHSSLLSTLLYIVNNKIVSMQTTKLSKCEAQCPGFKECLLNNIHYVSNLKPQTDLTLGDCSYLDTCHKLSTCRYVHYLQYIPQSLKERVSKESQEMNKIMETKNSKISYYTHGECCSSSFKTLLPPQWICCDVRKFDFRVLGKFSAVIADPAWNIHMNLPYGTCNDIELLELPLDQLQEEGVLFLWVTGRAIELGKESLTNWGYEVVNEIAWIKTNQLSRTIVTGRTGHWLNHSKEHLLVGIKGKPEWINRNIDLDLIVSITRETSRKPDELYGMVERMVGTHARKLEIFGRNHNVRPGWLTIGNQLTGNCIHEMDVQERYDSFLNSASA